MRLATVLTPMSDENLQMAAQCGVTDIVGRFTGESRSVLEQAKQKVAAFGLTLSVIEGYLPIERIKLGVDDGSEMSAMKTLIQNMGDAGIPLLCYNFMSGTDWARTRLDAPERGGAKVTEFRLHDVQRTVLLGFQNPEDSGNATAALTSSQLWGNLERMLNELLPVAEAASVTLAMHPDDPPLELFLGKARIMNSIESFERLMRLAPSSRNAICFCQGTFAEMGVDIPLAIRRLGKHIQYVHFRDIRGTRESFTETFHDNGQTDMFAAMLAYRDIGFDGPMRPDHVPQMVGEDGGEPGYTMLGRLFAFGYMRGLMQATVRRRVETI